MKNSKIRKAGDILLDLEPLLFELVEHGFQRGDILALVKLWIDVHAPSCIEVYNKNGTSPDMFYGDLLNLQKGILNDK